MRRWIIAAVVVLTALAVGIVALLNLNTYLNRNKDWLATRAEQVLGRDVQFAEIGVSLTQGFGVRVRNLRIADDPAFSNEPVVSAADAIVRMRIVPALFGRYEIARVVLVEPVINVVRTRGGLNLSTLGAQRGEPRAPGAQPAPHTGGTTGNAAFVIAYLSVENGTVHFVDRTGQPAVRADVSRIDFSASDVSMDRPLTFRLNAAAFDSRTQNVHANGSIGTLPTEAGAPVPLNIDVRADGIGIAALEHILAGALPEGFSATGPMSVSARAQGTTAAAGLELALTADDAHVRYGTLLDKAPHIPLRVTAKAKMTPDALNIDDAKVALHTAEVHVTGTAVLRAPNAYDLTVTSPATPLAGWEHVFPAVADYTLDGQVQLDVHAQGNGGGEAPNLRGTIRLQDIGARGRSIPAVSGLTTTVTFDGDRARMEPATFMLAGAPATLTADVKSLRARTLEIGLGADELHLAAFEQARPSDGAESTDTLRKVRVDGTVRAMENGPDAQGRVTSAAGTLRGLTYQNLAADVRYANSRAVLDPFSFATMGGTVRGHGVYEIKDEGRPTFQFESQLQGVRVGDFAAAFAPSAQHVLEGSVDGDVTLAGGGTNWETISRALTGSGHIGVRDGMLKDINIVDGVLQGLTGLPGLSAVIAPDLRQKYPRLFATNDTAFDALQGTFRIAEGKLSSNDLALRAADYAVNGRGDIGLDRSVDVAATLALSEQLSADLVQRADVVKNLGDKTGRVQIPFQLDGTLPSVRPRPDLDAVAHAVQRAAVEGLVGRLLDNERKRGAPLPAVPSQAPSGEPSAEASPAQAGAGSTAPGTPNASEDKAVEAKKHRGSSSAEKLLKGMGDLLGR